LTRLSADHIKHDAVAATVSFGMRTAAAPAVFAPWGGAMKNWVSGLVAAALLTTLSSPARATPLNPGFETGGFAPWTTTGVTAVLGPLNGVAPAQGAFQAAAASTSAVTDAALEIFLGLAPGSLDALAGAAGAFSGSGIRQTFAATAGEILGFAWNFLTFEDTPSFFNDTAFVVINGVLTELADTGSVFFPAASAEQTGYRQFSFVAPVTGMLTLGFGVVNVGDSVGDSTLLVDNVANVPEPVTLSLLGLGLLLASRKFARRRN
jgi:hypothetical protein